MAAPGQNVYMKGAFQPSSFPRTAFMQAYERVMQLSESSEHIAVLLMEYFPLHKVNSVPDDATAFRRGLRPNVLAVVYWKDDTPEKSRYARDAAHSISGIIAEASTVEAMGYGNYSRGHYSWQTVVK